MNQVNTCSVILVAAPELCAASSMSLCVVQVATKVSSSATSIPRGSSVPRWFCCCLANGWFLIACPHSLVDIDLQRLQESSKTCKLQQASPYQANSQASADNPTSGTLRRTCHCTQQHKRFIHCPGCSRSNSHNQPKLIVCGNQSNHQHTGESI